MDTCHIITGLGTGGAERILLRLLASAPGTHCVFSLTGSGTQEKELRDLGISVYNFNIKSCSFPIEIALLCRRVNQLQPKTIVGWMYHGNIAATVAGYLTNTPVIWNIRHSIADIRQEKLMTRGAIRMCAVLSNAPKKIVFNSHKAAVEHEALGYSAKRSTVLHNGINTDTYKPNPEAPAHLRKALGLPPNSYLIGHFARFHPMKDHLTLVKAAAQIIEKIPSAHFVLAGRDVTVENTKLLRAIEDLGIKDHFHMLGERADIPLIMAGLDVVALSSAWGEGFPNVVAEAMASGVPAVATDVGDTSKIIGDTGFVVLPGRPDELSNALIRLLKTERQYTSILGKKARSRIITHFSLGKIAEQYHSSWEIEKE